MKFDEEDLVLELQQKYPDFPIPRNWQFNQSFNLSVFAIAISVAGIILSVLAMYYSVKSFPTYYLGIPLPLAFAMGIIIFEMAGAEWISSKRKALDPGAEVYILNAFLCPNCSPPNKGPFFSLIRAQYEVMNDHAIVEFKIPVTYRIYPSLDYKPMPISKKSTTESKKNKRPLRKRFYRWYWYRANTKNVVFREHTIRIAQVIQHIDDTAYASIDLFAFERYVFRRFPINKNVPKFGTIHGPFYLARSVIFEEDHSLNTIIFADGSLWPPEEVIFHWIYLPTIG